MADFLRQLIKQSLKGNYFTCEKKNMISIIRKIRFVPSVRVSANKKQETYLKLGWIFIEKIGL